MKNSMDNYSELRYLKENLQLLERIRPELLRVLHVLECELPRTASVAAKELSRAQGRYEYASGHMDYLGFEQGKCAQIINQGPDTYEEEELVRDSMGYSMAYTSTHTDYSQVYAAQARYDQLNREYDAAQQKKCGALKDVEYWTKQSAYIAEKQSKMELYLSEFTSYGGVLHNLLTGMKGRIAELEKTLDSTGGLTDVDPVRIVQQVTQSIREADALIRGQVERKSREYTAWQNKRLKELEDAYRADWEKRTGELSAARTAAKEQHEALHAAAGRLERRFPDFRWSLEAIPEETRDMDIIEAMQSVEASYQRAMEIAREYAKKRSLGSKWKGIRGDRTQNPDFDRFVRCMRTVDHGLQIVDRKGIYGYGKIESGYDQTREGKARRTRYEKDCRLVREVCSEQIEETRQKGTGITEETFAYAKQALERGCTGEDVARLKGELTEVREMAAEYSEVIRPWLVVPLNTAKEPLLRKLLEAHYAGLIQDGYIVIPTWRDAYDTVCALRDAARRKAQAEEQEAQMNAQIEQDWARLMECRLDFDASILNSCLDLENIVERTTSHIETILNTMVRFRREHPDNTLGKDEVSFVMGEMLLPIRMFEGHPAYDIIRYGLTCDVPDYVRLPIHSGHTVLDCEKKGEHIMLAGTDIILRLAERLSI